MALESGNRKKDTLLDLAEQRFPGQNILILNGAKGGILSGSWPVPGWEQTPPPQDASLYDYILLEQKKPVRQLLNLVQDRGQSQTCELAITNNGETSWWSTRVEPLGQKGKSSHLLLLGTDITTQKLGEEPDLIAIPGQIANHLFHLLIEEGFLELFLDDNPDPYYASLLEFPVTEASVAGQKLARQQLIPGAYLLEHRRLWLTPLQPSFGNILLRRAQKIVVRWHEELHALEGAVSLEGIVRSQDQAAILLHFPHELRRSGMRGCRRIKIPFGLSLRATLFPKGGEPFEGVLDDISEEGMAFYYPDKMDPVAVWEKLQLNLRTPDGELVALRGEVCSLQKTQDRAESGVARHRCGVRFLSPDYTAERQLIKLVDRVEKRLQQVLLQKRRKFDMLLDDGC